MDTTSIPQTSIIKEAIVGKQEKIITKEKEATSEEVSVVAILHRMESRLTRIEQNQKWMIWAGSTVAAFLITLIFYLNNKIDTLDTKIDRIATEINAKIDKVATELNAKIDKVATEQREEIKRLDKKIDDIRDIYIIPMRIDMEKLKAKNNIK